MRASCLFLIVAGLLAGCHSDSTGDGPGNAPPSFGFGEPAEPKALLASPKMLLAPAQGSWEYHIFAGAGSGDSAEVRFEKVDDLEYPIRRYTADRCIEHLGFDVAGNLLMGAVEELEHQALTIYDPPLPVIPAALKPGQSMTVNCKMTVLNRQDNTRQIDKGTCAKTITYDADQSILRPAGPVECRRLTSTYTAKLGLASVEIQAQEWYAENQGLIAEKSDQKIHALIFTFGGAKTLILTGRPK